MRILITGGAGFIGSAVTKNLREHGLETKTLDIINPREKQGEHLLGSIMNQEDLAKAMQGCDAIIHLAAMVGVKRTDIKRKECLDINILGTRNVLKQAAKAGIKKIVFSSSSEVYGEPDKIPVKETDPVHPKSVYGVTKLAGEEYLRAFSRDGGPAFSIIRFFNVYGTGQVAEFVMPRFVKAVLDDKPPVVYGDGNQERAFCHINDTAEGVYLALTKDEANSQIFNIGNDQTTIKMKDLAQKVIELSDKNLKPKFIPMTESDRDIEREIIKRTPDINKAKQVLGFQPKINLDEGIKKVMAKGNIQETWIEPMK